MQSHTVCYWLGDANLPYYFGADFTCASNIFLISVRSDVMKRIKYTVCGNISNEGTPNGKLRNIGSNTVNVGMDKIIFELWGWKNINMSLVFSMIIIEVRNASNSIVMFVGLSILISIP